MGIGLRGTTGRVDDFGARTPAPWPPARRPAEPLRGRRQRNRLPLLECTCLRRRLADHGLQGLPRNERGWTETFLANASTPSYPDGVVTNGTTYYYKVSAENAIGESAPSNEASATPTAPPEPPGTPTDLQALAGDGTVSLSWTAPSFDGGSPITGYRVYRGTSPGGETFLQSTGAVTSFHDSGLVNGTTYYYKVTALNAIGEGSLSNEASATPTDLVPPVEPLPTLDSFNRANENPLSDAGRWGNGIIGSAERSLRVVSNRLASTRTTTTTAWRNNAQYGPDSEAWATITTLPGNGNSIRLYVRLQQPGSSAVDGYMLFFTQSSGTDQVAIYRITNGALISLQTVSREITVGSRLLLRAKGSALESWAHDGSAWTRLSRVTDSTYSAAGYVGVGIRGKTGRLDDFGGALVRQAAESPLAGVTATGGAGGGSIASSARRAVRLPRTDTASRSRSTTRS